MVLVCSLPSSTSFSLSWGAFFLGFGSRGFGFDCSGCLVDLVDLPFTLGGMGLGPSDGRLESIPENEEKNKINRDTQ